MNAIRLSLERDDRFDRFYKLKWEIVNTSIDDVLRHGVHPWSDASTHGAFAEGLLRGLNVPETKFTDLVSMGYGHDVVPPSAYFAGNGSLAERALRAAHDQLYFAASLKYLDLVEISRGWLTKHWDSALALTLAQRAYPAFMDLRRFLKSRDGRLRIRSRDDVQRLNLGRILKVDDFGDHEQLLLDTALASRSFRAQSALEQVADREGRVRFVPEFRQVTLTLRTDAREQPKVLWHARKVGEYWRLRPDLGPSLDARTVAARFAKRWREDAGRLCFNVSTERIVQMVEEGFVLPSFPSLSYLHASSGTEATVHLRAPDVAHYTIGEVATGDYTCYQLRSILRAHGASGTGKKEELFAKAAQLAAMLYTGCLDELHEHFVTQKFVLVPGLTKKGAEWPVLRGVSNFRSLLLTMYALRHLRGGAILDASHENDTYSPAELAQALLCGKLTLQGGFVPVG